MEQKPNMLQRIKNISLRKIITLTSLSAVAFTFQACYGTMQDYDKDVLIEGVILSSNSEKPIPSIKIEVQETYHNTYSNELGEFSMYVPIDSAYTLLFHDVDGTENGAFYPAKLTLENPEYKQLLEAEMKLTPTSNN